MTTIAWDGQILAGDSSAVNGSLKRNVTKVVMLRDGRLFGSCGDNQDRLLAIDYLNGDAPMPELEPDGFAGIIIKDGQAYRVENRLRPDLIQESFYAIGSGRDFAMMAMFLGKGAYQAVELASHFDVNTCGPIISLTGASPSATKLSVPVEPKRKVDGR